MRRLILAALVLVACSSTNDPDDGEPRPGVLTLRLTEVASGLSNPVYLTSPPGDSRLFVVEQGGRIKIIQNGQVLATPFLDISARVLAGGERGLLSVAFHPQYSTNGFFYVYYTGTNGDIRVSRFTVTADANVANASSEKSLLTVSHPRSNHNGGLAVFGPDGFLYLGLGDGGGGGDPDGNGQKTSALLGKILRIDVNSGDPYGIPAGNPFAGQAGARVEIWAYGVRNPWRFSFDRTAGLMYLADVGQDQLEEVDVVPSTRAGVNYGWNITEGSSCYAASSCNKTGIQLPVIEYSHSSGGCSITGGYVYRGSALPEIAGQYFYSDYCLGFLRSFEFANGTATNQRTWDVGSIGSVTSFGEDAVGELYVLTSSGKIYKLTR